VGLDLDSTNGTRRNGQPISSKTPQPIRNGDVLSLGNLQLAVYIVEGPGEWAARLDDERDMASALVHLATVITAQLKVDDVLSRILKMTIDFTHSDAAALWLIDEKSGDLVLRAEQGIDDRTANLTQIPAKGDYQINQVIKTRKPLRVSRLITKEPIKIKTDYLVEAVILTPLLIGDIAIGVLAAIHREKDRDFSVKDEQRLSTISKFAVIAIQNSREYEATNRSLAKRVNELDAINGVSQALSAAQDMNGVYDVLRSNIRKHWTVENVGLWLLDEADQVLEPFPKPTFHREYRIGEGIVGKVAQTMEPKLGHNVPLQANPPGESDDSNDTTLLIVDYTIACVPLIMKNRAIGVLAALSTTKGSFDAEDVKLLQSFSHPAAAAIQNAKLFAYIEEQWATVLAAMNMLPHPLMIVNKQGEMVVSNDAAKALLEEVSNQAQKAGEPFNPSKPLLQLLEGLSESRWRTLEITVGDKVFVTTVEDSSWEGTVILMQDVTEVDTVDNADLGILELILNEIDVLNDSIKSFTHLVRGTEMSQAQIKDISSIILELSDQSAIASSQLFDVATQNKAGGFDVKSCSVKEVVDRVKRNTKGAALAKSIWIESEVTGKPFEILCDCTFLYLSILKLVKNAIDVSPAKSTVSIKMAYGPDEFLLTVLDAGPVYSPKEKEQIFTRADSSEDKKHLTKRAVKNLAAVKEAIAASGGSIRVQDREKGGSSFEIRFSKPQ
jgi:GAF domain-containing protein